jgi:hypothetical protein
MNLIIEDLTMLGTIMFTGYIVTQLWSTINASQNWRFLSIDMLIVAVVSWITGTIIGRPKTRVPMLFLKERKLNAIVLDRKDIFWQMCG